jgi:hypothetical protein
MIKVLTAGMFFEAGRLLSTNNDEKGLIVLFMGLSFMVVDIFTGHCN